MIWLDEAPSLTPRVAARPGAVGRPAERRGVDRELIVDQRERRGAEVGVLLGDDEAGVERGLAGVAVGGREVERARRRAWSSRPRR